MRKVTYILLGLFIIIAIFGKNIVLYLSDKYQRKICIDSGNICINKPKGYLPVFVKDNGRLSFMYLIKNDSISQIFN